MASGGNALPPISKPPPSQTWAQIAPKVALTSENSLLYNPQLLSMLKNSTSQFVRLDNDFLARARMRFQHSLYGKFFSKPSPFEQVKMNLLAKWMEIGEVSISDLSNGFLLIRCASHVVMQRILMEGPWSINGIILQLSPWQPFFEPAFAKLNTAAIWVQLYNLPIDFWEAETLDTVTAHIGNLLKVDDFTFSLVCSRFSRVCLEVDLSKPLSCGV